MKIKTTLEVDSLATFATIPVGPASNPTTDNQLTRKAYVDSLITSTTSIDPGHKHSRLWAFDGFPEALTVDGGGNVNVAVGTFTLGGTHLVYNSSSAVINYGPGGIFYIRELSVQGDPANYANRIVIYDSGGVSIGSTSYDAGVNNLYVQGNAYLMGNVGIGTTSPGAKLEVKSTTPVIRIFDSDVYPFDGSGMGKIAFGAGSEEFASIECMRNTGNYDDVSHLVFRTSWATGAGGDGTNKERMRLTYDGELGIGTNNPAAKLHVNGCIMAASWNAPPYAGFGFDQGGYDTGIWSDADGVIKFRINGGYGVIDHTMTADGEFHIGGTDPAARLQVNGGILVNEGMPPYGGYGFSETGNDTGMWSDYDGTIRLRLNGGQFEHIFYPDGNIFFDENVSALSYTDRTPYYKGDALAELALVKGKKNSKGEDEIDHSTLPVFARKTLNRKRVVDPVTGQTEDAMEEGRDIGAMISILTVAVQQLQAKIEALESKNK